jgi:hypothetical protein
MAGELYIDGIHDAVKAGDISYHDCSPTTFGPADAFSFLRNKDNGTLTSGNTRGLLLHVRPYAHGVIGAWTKERPGQPMQCLLCGPGAGKEIHELQSLLPEGSSIDSMSLTPVNPRFSLLQSSEDIQKRMRRLIYGEEPVPTFSVADFTSIDHVWEMRDTLPDALASNNVPSPRHQYIGEFPKAMSGKLKTFPRYQFILENLGIVHHSSDNYVLAELYELLAKDGAMYIPGFFSIKQIDRLKSATDRHDLFVHNESPNGSLFVARSESPMYAKLKRNTPALQPYHPLPKGSVWRWMHDHGAFLE